VLSRKRFTSHGGPAAPTNLFNEARIETNLLTKVVPYQGAHHASFLLQHYANMTYRVTITTNSTPAMSL